MYVQNQDISPFFQNHWNDLRYISNDQHLERKICYIIDTNLLYSSLCKCSYIFLEMAKMLQCTFRTKICTFRTKICTFRTKICTFRTKLFCLENSVCLEEAVNEYYFFTLDVKISTRNEADCVIGIFGILDPLNAKILQILGRNDKIPIYQRESTGQRTFSLK